MLPAVKIPLLFLAIWGVFAHAGETTGTTVIPPGATPAPAVECGPPNSRAVLTEMGKMLISLYPVGAHYNVDVQRLNQDTAISETVIRGLSCWLFSSKDNATKTIDCSGGGASGKETFKVVQTTQIYDEQPVENFQLSAVAPGIEQIKEKGFDGERYFPVVSNVTSNRDELRMSLARAVGCRVYEPDAQSLARSASAEANPR